MLGKGKTLFTELKINEAVTVFEETVKDAPDSAEAHAWLSLTLGYMSGQVPPQDWQKQMEYGMRSGQEAGKALQLDPNHPVARLSRGIGSLFTPPQYGGSVENAIKDLEVAVKGASEKVVTAEAHYWLGAAYDRQGNKDKALSEWKKTLEIDPKHPQALKAIEKGKK